MLNEQYRMHPQISHFPRHIFYGGTLLDGPNVTKPDYGNPLIKSIMSRVPSLKVSFTSRYGTSFADASIHLSYIFVLVAIHCFRSRLKRRTRRHKSIQLSRSQPCGVSVYLVEGNDSGTFGSVSARRDHAIFATSKRATKTI